MTKTTKIPAFPTHQDIIDHINTVIRPEPGRIRDMHRLAMEATGLVADNDPGDPLGNLVLAMIHEGATPTAKEFADAALDAERHAVIERAQNRIEAERSRHMLTASNYPTSEQNAQILDYLSEVMDKLITAARALPDNAPINADAAIAHGDQGPELLTTLRRIVAAYDEVRSQQRAASTISHADVNVSGHFKDATNVDAYWIRKRRLAAKENLGRFERGTAPGIDDARAYFEGTPRAPWEPISGGAYPKNVKTSEDRARFVLWAARNAEPWVPSDSELAEKHIANSELTFFRTWIQPEFRRNVSDADVRNALASVRNQVSATA